MTNIQYTTSLQCCNNLTTVILSHIEQMVVMNHQLTMLARSAVARRPVQKSIWVMANFLIVIVR